MGFVGEEMLLYSFTGMGQIPMTTRADSKGEMFAERDIAGACQVCESQLYGSNDDIHSWMILGCDSRTSWHKPESPALAGLS